MNTVGRTTEGQLVLGGVFRFAETHGLPFDSLFEALRQRSALPCWMTFFREARHAGMAPDRILAKMEPALLDVYGTAFRDVVLHGLRTLLTLGRLE